MDPAALEEEQGMLELPSEIDRNDFKSPAHTAGRPRQPPLTDNMFHRFLLLVPTSIICSHSAKPQKLMKFMMSALGHC